jgi:hypothetical protein
MRGVSVTEIMKPNATQATSFSQLLPFVGKAARLHRLAARARHDKRVY